MMKRIARDVQYIDPSDAIATRKEISHASGMEVELIGRLVIMIKVSKIYRK